ncbi:DUF1499 domain-containing protein [Halomonas sp. C05BenzN]|uniref:DUF1499 domain-containing protein n=1 Tax=Halomonas sp. C05BenzN TaxID=3411041 RepID=UPI003B9504C2
MSTFRLRNRPRGGRWPVVPAWLGVLLLVAGAALMGGAGPGHRMGLVPLGTAFDLLRLGAYLAVAAAALGLLALVIATLCRRLRPALAGLLVILAVAGMMAVPWQMMQRAQRVPPIHDITTDTHNPPEFVTLAPAREAAPNAVGYTPSFASQQRRAYPSIQPLVLEQPLARVLSAAEDAAREMGWEIAALTDTTLEATATTRWFGFKDDVVIRLTETDTGVRVDVRSASRIGRSDLGTNAARIVAYMDRLEGRLDGG